MPAMLSSTAAYSPDDITAMIRRWGDWDNTCNNRAGVHLLAHTTIAQTPRVLQCLHIREEWDRESEPGVQQRITVASVADWDGLIKLGTGSERDMLILARALIAHAAIVMPMHMSGFGHIHAKTVIEAIAIALGYDQWWNLAPGPKKMEFDRLMTGLVR